MPIRRSSKKKSRQGNLRDQNRRLRQQLLQTRAQLDQERRRRVLPPPLPPTPPTPKKVPQPSPKKAPSPTPKKAPSPTPKKTPQKTPKKTAEKTTPKVPQTSATTTSISDDTSRRIIDRFHETDSEEDTIQTPYAVRIIFKFKAKLKNPNYKFDSAEIQFNQGSHRHGSPYLILWDPFITKQEIKDKIATNPTFPEPYNSRPNPTDKYLMFRLFQAGELNDFFPKTEENFWVFPNLVQIVLLAIHERRPMATIRAVFRDIVNDETNRLDEYMSYYREESEHYRRAINNRRLQNDKLSNYVEDEECALQIHEQRLYIKSKDRIVKNCLLDIILTEFKLYTEQDNKKIPNYPLLLRKMGRIKSIRARNLKEVIMNFRKEVKTKGLRIKDIVPMFKSTVASLYIYDQDGLVFSIKNPKAKKSLHIQVNGNHARLLSKNKCSLSHICHKFGFKDSSINITYSRTALKESSQDGYYNFTVSTLEDIFQCLQQIALDVNPTKPPKGIILWSQLSYHDVITFLLLRDGLEIKGENLSRIVFSIRLVKTGKKIPVTLRDLEITEFNDPDSAYTPLKGVPNQLSQNIILQDTSLLLARLILSPESRSTNSLKEDFIRSLFRCYPDVRYWGYNKDIHITLFDKENFPEQNSEDYFGIDMIRCYTYFMLNMKQVPIFSELDETRQPTSETIIPHYLYVYSTSEPRLHDPLSIYSGFGFLLQKIIALKFQVKIYGVRKSHLIQTDYREHITRFILDNPNIPPKKGKKIVNIITGKLEATTMKYVNIRQFKGSGTKKNKKHATEYAKQLGFQTILSYSPQTLKVYKEKILNEILPEVSPSRDDLIKEEGKTPHKEKIYFVKQTTRAPLEKSHYYIKVWLYCLMKIKILSDLTLFDSHNIPLIGVKTDCYIFEKKYEAQVKQLIPLIDKDLKDNSEAIGQFKKEPITGLVCQGYKHPQNSPDVIPPPIIPTIIPTPDEFNIDISPLPSPIRLQILAETPGCGKTFLMILFLAQPKYKRTLLLCPTNRLTAEKKQEIQEKIKDGIILDIIESDTLYALIGFRKNKAKIDLNEYDAIGIDEIFMYPLHERTALKKIIAKTDIDCYAAGDMAQLANLEFSNIPYTEEEISEQITSIFPQQIILKVNKRGKTKEERKKHALAKQIIIKEWDGICKKQLLTRLHDQLGIHIVHEEDIPSPLERTITYTNATCQARNQKIFSYLGRKDYAKGDYLISKERFQDDGIHKGFIYRIEYLGDDLVSLIDISTDSKHTIYRKHLKNFLFSNIDTVNSVQGCTIKTPYYIFDIFHPNVFRRWIYVAISRAQVLSNIHIVIPGDSNTTKREFNSLIATIQRNGHYGYFCRYLESLKENDYKKVLMKRPLPEHSEEEEDSEKQQLSALIHKLNIPSFSQLESNYISVMTLKNLFTSDCSKCNATFTFSYDYRDNLTSNFHIAKKNLNLPYLSKNCIQVCSNCL